MCLYPKLIKNRKYVSNKKNGGVIPTVSDERVKWVAVGCQKCMECKKQKARAWQVRLLEDIKENKNSKFITLTYSTEALIELINMKPSKNWPGMDDLKGYDLDNEIATRSVRLFLERWRKEYKKSLRHWLVTELGQNNTEHIHLHGLIWTDEKLDKVQEKWGYGFVWKGQEKNGRIQQYVNYRTVNYLIKYVHKSDKLHPGYNSKVLTSPGIGANYMTSYNSRSNYYDGTETIETYRTPDGSKIALPIYWRNKLYSDEERERLWINKLDKNERWVLGQRVSIKDNYDDYYGVLEVARKRNREMGFGDDEKNFEKELYERNTRIIKQQQRLQQPTAKQPPRPSV